MEILEHEVVNVWHAWVIWVILGSGILGLTIMAECIVDEMPVGIIIGLALVITCVIFIINGNNGVYDEYDYDKYLARLSDTYPAVKLAEDGYEIMSHQKYTDIYTLKKVEDK